MKNMGAFKNSILTQLLPCQGFRLGTESQGLTLPERPLGAGKKVVSGSASLFLKTAKFLAFTMFFMGCASSEPAKTEIMDRGIPPLETIKVSEFILGVGDEIEVTVFRKEMSEFLIGVGDELNISVYKQEDLNKTVKVDPSGKIAFPLIGDLQAAGKSEFELRDEIKEKLFKYLVDPHVAVTIKSTQKRSIEDFEKSYIVRPPGTITIPFIGDIQASGISVLKLREEIEEKLSEYLVNPQVIINVVSVKSKKVMVLGEVQQPGIFTLDSDMSVLEALSLAGGMTDNAQLKNVILIRKEGDKQETYSLDIKNTFKKEGGMSGNTSLQNGDIVYLPASLYADIGNIFSHISQVLNSLVALETGIVLGPMVKDTFSGGRGGGVAIPTR